MCLNGFINPGQTAFIPGRKISDNVLLAQKLTRNYHRDDQLLRCTVKFDILKVYKLVEWSSFKVFAIGCPEKLFGWIKTCISIPQYSIA